MVNYQNGKIYRLEGGGLTYYGSTVNRLCERLASHKRDYNYLKEGKRTWMSNSKLLFEAVDDINEVKIYLEEKYPCNTKEELTGREGWWIKNNECTNKCIAGRTSKEYYEDNKNKILTRVKKYRENNKDKIKERTKRNYECQCGSVIRIYEKKTTFKNQKTPKFYH